MKIEIEFAEVEKLRNDNLKLHEELREVKEKLALLDENKIKQDAVELSMELFRAYINAVFTKLGFDDAGFYGPIEFSDNLSERLGMDWWERRNAPGLKIEVRANVCESFRKAFLKIGVLAKPVTAGGQTFPLTAGVQAPNLAVSPVPVPKEGVMSI